jgi:NodT family efflux transporter outer membrane factor (OMF) lipoprotein
MKKISFPSLAASFSLCLLGGCTVGPDFTGADSQTPSSWHDVSAANSNAAHPNDNRITTDADPDPKWWLTFNDPVLSSLIDRATQGNPDFQIAVIRIAEARAGEQSAESAGLPSLSGSGLYRRAGVGEGLLGGASGTGSGGNANPTGLLGSLSKPVNIYEGALDASWQLDLFGKVRRSVEAANAASAAAIGNRDDALVTLEAEVAQTYAQLRAAQASRQTAQSDFDTERQILSLTEARALHGLVTDLDVQNAKTTLGETEASLAQYDLQIAASMNGLAVLTGAAPGTLDAELSDAAPIPQAPPRVPVGLPSSLARRRPDIRVAEANLHRQTAEIGVAEAQFYPDISLTGQVGLAGMQPRDLTRWANKFYEFGPAISLPIFEGGQLTANLNLAKAEQAEAAAEYRKTVLTALQDVENALAAYRTELRRNRALEETVAAQTAALDIAQAQYSHGVATFINVLTAENSLAQQHQALIQSTLSLTTDVVNLYKALGGGWQSQSDAS